ncbi:MAG: cupredoxin domain-containing protein [Acetobacteraceae bacterium]|nr:cupredoxin domain-containing protein [Acetobacteraceae bacterium]
MKVGSRLWGYSLIAAAVVFTTAALAAFGIKPEHFVSQKDQVFTPGKLVIKRGETVEIVNDDGDLLHHLYIDTKQLQFDSGDQEPGAKVAITFPAAGSFDVLCGIHPKMKLVIDVK